MVLAIILEVLGLALGGRSTIVPTLSSTFDRLLVNHFERELVFLAWLAVGLSPLMRNRRVDPSGEPDVIGTLGWLALLGLSLLVDFAARQHPTKRKTLTNFIAPLTSRRSGRITLLVSGPSSDFTYLLAIRFPSTCRTSRIACAGIAGSKGRLPHANVPRCKGQDAQVKTVRRFATDGMAQSSSARSSHHQVVELLATSRWCVAMSNG